MSKSNLLFEAGSADFFHGMGKTLSTAVVKSNQLNKNNINEKTFFGPPRDPLIPGGV